MLYPPPLSLSLPLFQSLREKLWQTCKHFCFHWCLVPILKWSLVADKNVNNACSNDAKLSISKSSLSRNKASVVQMSVTIIRSKNHTKGNYALIFIWFDRTVIYPNFWNAVSLKKLKSKTKTVKGWHFTPPQNRGAQRSYIFTSVCLCVYMFLNKIPAKRMHQFGHGYR